MIRANGFLAVYISYIYTGKKTYLESITEIVGEKRGNNNFRNAILIKVLISEVFTICTSH